MAVTIANTVTQSEDSPHHSKAIQKTLRQQELEEKLLRQASAHIQILEEQRRPQQLTMLYQATFAQSIRAETLQAQTTQAQAILSIDTLERESTKVLSPVDLNKLLTPIDPDWEYKATKELLLWWRPGADAGRGVAGPPWCPLPR